MNYLVLFVTILNCNYCFPYVRKPLIIDGFDCSPEDYPFLVTIGKTGHGHVCGGTLVGANWVLTAGHCCYKRNAEDLFVSTDLSSKYVRHPETRIKQLFIHPEFKRDVLGNDICLVLLETPISSNGRFRYVNISYEEPSVSLVKSCQKSLILGFGRQSRLSVDGVNVEPDKPFFSRLKCAHLSLMTSVTCKMVIHVDPSQFCAVDFSEKQQDACIGDSGGPIVCDEAQIGIVSAGYGCGLPQKPSLFTRLDIFEGFISDTMSKNVGHKFQMSKCMVLLQISFWFSLLNIFWK